MKNFEDSEYFLLKAMSKSVIDALSPVLEKVSKLAERLVFDVEIIDKKLENAESGLLINQLSESSAKKRDALIRMLAIKNRLDVLINKNKDRVKYIDGILKAAGIYNEAFDHKLISKIEKEEMENISEDALNINPVNSLGDEYQDVFFAGEILKLKNGVLDFSEEHNKAVLRASSDEFIAEIIKSFPSSISTISADVLANSAIKKSILKSLATFVVDEAKKQDMKTINKTLGNLLQFKTQFTSKPEDYIAGVSNMFNFQVKNFMLQTNPAKRSQIEAKLKCNEKSELIPESKRVVVLAGGVAGDISPENEESQEERISREKEMGTTASNDFFESFIRKLAKEAQQIEQTEEQEIDKTMTAQRELEKKVKEEQISKQEKKEVEELENENAPQMYRTMSDNRYDD